MNADGQMDRLGGEGAEIPQETKRCSTFNMCTRISDEHNHITFLAITGRVILDLFRTPSEGGH